MDIENMSRAEIEAYLASKDEPKNVEPDWSQFELNWKDHDLTREFRLLHNEWPDSQYAKHVWYGRWIGFLWDRPDVISNHINGNYCLTVREGLNLYGGLFSLTLGNDDVFTLKLLRGGQEWVSRLQEILAECVPADFAWSYIVTGVS